MVVTADIHLIIRWPFIGLHPNPLCWSTTPQPSVQVNHMTRNMTSLLLLDPEPQIAPTLDFLMKTCNVTLDEAVLIIIGCPQAICLSRRNLEKKVRITCILAEREICM